MKRYNLVLDEKLDGELRIRSYVTDHGEWVKWEDVKEYTQRMIAFAIAKAIIEIEISKTKEFIKTI